MDHLETAKDVCAGALRNNARITAIIATDAAGSERSVHFEFTPEQSIAILQAVLTELKAGV